MTSIPAARFEAEVVGAGDSNEMKESNESNEKKEEVEADRRMACKPCRWHCSFLMAEV